MRLREDEMERVKENKKKAKRRDVSCNIPQVLYIAQCSLSQVHVQGRGGGGGGGCGHFKVIMPYPLPHQRYFHRLPPH